MRLFLRRFRESSKAPFFVALLLAVPIFIQSLLASTLAIEHPTVLAWRNCIFYKKATTTHAKAPGRCFLDTSYSAPSSSNEAKIWLAAVVVPLALVLLGLVLIAWRRVARYGVYVVCVAGATYTLLLTTRVDTWSRHHTQRFGVGIDFVRDSNQSNSYNRGEWEREAVSTIRSMSHAITLLAVALAVGFVIAAYRRKRLLERMMPIDTLAPPEPEIMTPSIPAVPDSVSER